MKSDKKVKKEEILKYSAQFYQGEISIKEIAKRVGCSYTTVSKNLVKQKVSDLKEQKPEKSNVNEADLSLLLKMISQENGKIIDKTVGDWDSMTEEEQEPYLITDPFKDLEYTIN